MISRLQRIFPQQVRIAAIAATLFSLSIIGNCEVAARPSSSSSSSGKGKHEAPQSFLRQRNTYSNMSFYFTNNGILFNNSNVAGLFWPRGVSDNYIFGGGLWFATQKIIQGKRRKLCELGYNPNSGSGWYKEGFYQGPDGSQDGANPDAKYISYVGPRYDRTSGKYLHNSTVVPSPGYAWPLWDTSSTKTLKHDFYFGDYIDDVSMRAPDKLKKNGQPALPAIISEEDIVNVYTDADPVNNPEFRPGLGYPFNINVVEVIYSWSFGRYRDMIFLRHKVTNASKDTLINCYLAPAFDPDLGPSSAPQGGSQNDHNRYISDSDASYAKIANLREPYRSHPSTLNMGYNYSEKELGKEFGVIGFSFLESPTIDDGGNLVPNDDTAHLGEGSYGPKSLFRTHSLGLTTFRKWNINNDPPTPDLRYDFAASGAKDGDNAIGEDVRMLFSTGPFTMKPGQTVESTVAIACAHPSTIDPKVNLEGLLSQMDFAHQVFGEVQSSVGKIDTSKHPNDTTFNYFVNHFISPVPPDVPNLTAQSLDRAVLLTWDSTADMSYDPLSNPSHDPNSGPLAFVGYQLFRTTRSDHDSTIRPDGQNPIVKLGEWSRYDFRKDSIFDNRGHWTGVFHYTRINVVPHPIPHSFLDVGDDDHDGLITGNEGLVNGVRYYYYLIAFDEYDSINKIGPLFTSIVPPKSFVSEVPSKPPFLSTNYNLTGQLGCGAGGVSSIRLEVTDTGRFLQLFTNDKITVSFQPRWAERNPLRYSNIYLYVDVVDSTRNLNLTFDALNDPTGVTSPYNTNTYINYLTPGQLSDTTLKSQFTTDNTFFAPNQNAGGAFKVLVDFTFVKLLEPYHLNKVHASDGAKQGIIHLSQRTNNSTNKNLNYDNILPQDTRTAFIGGLGQKTYEVHFGAEQTQFSQPVFDTTLKQVVIYHTMPNQDSTIIYTPSVLPVTVISNDCNPPITLPHIRPFSLTDEVREGDTLFFDHPGGNLAPYNDPDTMKVPLPGQWALDAFHFQSANNNDYKSASFFRMTTGPLYWPLWGQGNSGVKGTTNEYHAVVHRLRLGGAEIIFNAPGILQAKITGDTIPGHSPITNDFRPGDVVTVAFRGGQTGLPFPGQTFDIYTPSGAQVDYKNAQLYTKNLLDQVQVVPNPYIVTHDGQTSTDNAKLFFTRLPPRATILIYNVAGDLVKTIEHNGFLATTLNDPNNKALTITTYNTDVLGDRSSVEEWNLLTEGKQRIGSQVLIARVIAKDAQHGDAVMGETTVKFAVVVGGFRVVK